MLQNVILNEAETMKTWSGFITESTGVTDRSKLTWMTKYCAYHDMHEKQELNESVHGYAHLNPNMNVGGMGAMAFPGANPNNGYDGQRGSGDNPFSLLPLAVQVAAQTIALDLVPVVPMQGPLGILQYMDYVYEGGRTNRLPRPGDADLSKTSPLMVKLKLTKENGKPTITELKEVFTPGKEVVVDDYTLKFVAFGRIDGNPIFQVLDAYNENKTTSLAEALFGKEKFVQYPGKVEGTVEELKSIVSDKNTLQVAVDDVYELELEEIKNTKGVSEIILDNIQHTLFLLKNVRDQTQLLLEVIPNIKIYNFVKNTQGLKGIMLPGERADINKKIIINPTEKENVQ